MCTYEAAEHRIGICKNLDTDRLVDLRARNSLKNEGTRRGKRGKGRERDAWEKRREEENEVGREWKGNSEGDGNGCLKLPPGGALTFLKQFFCLIIYYINFRNKNLLI